MTNLSISSIPEALQTECTCHHELVQALGDICGHRPNNPATPQGDHLYRNDKVPLVRISTSNQKEHGIYALRWRPDVDQHPGCAVEVDHDWIDFYMAQKWLHACKTTHRKCRNTMKLSFCRPTWVIDTKDRCLVPGRSCDSFIALSYVWGPGASNLIDGDTTDRMRVRGGLDDSGVWARFPPIACHVIALTPLLGERYVWIDALCIDHRNSAESVHQLSLMGAIYASAVVTVMLLDGDAQDGLPGIKSVSYPRKLAAGTVAFGEETLLYRSGGSGGIEGINYFQRGWTYQEFMMAGRRLTFSLKSGHVEWLCNTDQALEGGLHTLMEQPSPNGDEDDCQGVVFHATITPSASAGSATSYPYSTRAISALTKMPFRPWQV